MTIFFQAYLFCTKLSGSMDMPVAYLQKDIQSYWAGYITFRKSTKALSLGFGLSPSQKSVVLYYVLQDYKNMKYKIQGLIAVICALSLCFFSCKKNPPDCSLQELYAMKQAVEHQLKMQSVQIMEQLAGFSKAVVSDRDFSMKLFVENNRQAPEVADFALRYMESMGFSILEITDSKNVLLSCAQFPASAGASIAGKAALINDNPVFIDDNVKGQKILTLQARTSFKILDSTLYCGGGYIISDSFIAGLSPCKGFKIVIKQDSLVMGAGADSAVSGITDSTVIINGLTYWATSINLPYSGQGAAPEILLINENAAVRNQQVLSSKDTQSRR